MANLVDAKIADVQSSSDKNAKARLPQEVIDYINDPRNGITISGLSEKKLTDAQIKEKNARIHEDAFLHRILKNARFFQHKEYQLH